MTVLNLIITFEKLLTIGFFNDNFKFFLFLVCFFKTVTSKRKHAKLPLHRTAAIVGSIINHLSNLTEKRCGVERYIFCYKPVLLYMQLILLDIYKSPDVQYKY